MRCAQATSSMVGLKAVLTASTWVGWMQSLPAKPSRSASDRLRLAAREGRPEPSDPVGSEHSGCHSPGPLLGRPRRATGPPRRCPLYTSDAADDLLCVDLGGRR